MQRGPWTRYGVALVTVAAAVFVRTLLDPILGARHPFAPLYVAVTVSAWYGGLRPALAAIALGYFVADWLFVAPRYDLTFLPYDTEDFVNRAVFVTVALAIAGISHSMRAAEQRARAERDAVERRVAERARQEEALRQSEARFRELTDTLPQIVWAARADGYTDYYNERWYEFTDLPRGQGGDASWEPILHPDDVGRTREAWYAAVGSGEPYQIEYRFRERGAARYRWFLGRALPVRDVSGTIVRWYGTCTDIDEQKRAQQERDALLVVAEEARSQAEAASQAKDTFLATVSHELRTPLSPILAWARMLNQGTLDEARSRRALDTIERCAKTQAQLIEDLLDVSRIIAGKFRLDVQPVDVVAVIRAALEVVRPAADAKGIRLASVLDERSGPVAGDPERLQQAVWNLLANAVKFTPKGGRVQVCLERVDSHLEIAVSDTGQGITPEFRPHVFERFEQADPSSTRRHGGLGLGLAIVRHIVEAHGGSVDVESPGPDRGSVFTMRLPMLALARDAGERRHPLSAPSLLRAPYPSLAGLRVLVVDDEPDSNEVVRTLLVSCGAEVEVAASAAQARERLGQWKADLLVSDIGMPEEDGFALIAAVRSQAGDPARIPAVALTAYASRDDRIRLLAAGFQAHVPKPVDPTELVTVVANLARTSRHVWG